MSVPLPPPGWQPMPAPTRRRLGPVVVIVSAAALLAGALIGGLIGYRSGKDGSAPASVSPTVAASPDPVCAEWEAQSRGYEARTQKWSQSDADVPASDWSPATRALNMGIIGVLQQESADLRKLAAKAHDRFLASLMLAQAVYEEAYAERIPNYQPSDDDLWQAVSSFVDSTQAVCGVLSGR